MKTTFTVLHLFCGIGGKALGFGASIAKFQDSSATFVNLGGIDFDSRACRDFEMLTGAPSLCMDMHQVEPADLIKFIGPVAPDVVTMSPPCKGFSGLLSAKRAMEPKYQKMNTLMERAIFLVMSTWPKPPSLVFVENVPRIASRGKETVRRCVGIGEAHGFAVTTGNHDCGEIGNLAQHRRRWFALFRHREQLAQCVYEPARHPVRACGEVIGPMPLPGDIVGGGAMHSIPKLSLRNWIRLSLIPAGGDWRDLPGTLEPGQARRTKFRRDPVTAWDATAETVTGPGGSASTNVADPRVLLGEDNDNRHRSKFGVLDFDDVSPTVTSSSTSGGAPSIADPRFGNVDKVTAWDAPVGTITRSPAPSSGAAAVADPRAFALPPSDGRHWNKYAVTAWEDPAATVTGTDTRVGSGAPSVADPRWGGGALGVTGWDEAAATVTGESLPSNGRNAVADPRVTEIAAWTAAPAYRGILGVAGFDETSGTITGNAKPASGRFAVADPRIDPETGNKPAWQRVAGVTPWTEPAPTVTSGAKIHAGAFQVADPRVDDVTDVRVTSSPRAGAYRVLRWNDSAATITAALGIDNGAAAVADPRVMDKPPKIIPLIIAEDGTWHRPLTTYELAALQGFPLIVNGKPLMLDGTSHTRWREAIGNAVPPPAAESVGNQLLFALLVGKLGAFALNNNRIWVAPVIDAMVA